MTNRLYERIYAVIRQIPPGKVATYGQVANIVGECSPRMVGYALAALKSGSDVPWQRVINSQGKISLRNHGGGCLLQQQLLVAEGIYFDENDKVNLKKFGWSGPERDWLMTLNRRENPKTTVVLVYKMHFCIALT